MENIDLDNISKEELIALLTKQKKINAEQNASITQQKEKIEALTTQVKILEEYVALAKQRQFAA